MAVYVLKVGHRIHRDYRLDTHLALAARAFLADKLYYSGQKDSKYEETINKVSEKFGGNFYIEYVDSHIKLIKSFHGKKVHLSIYGKELTNEIKFIRKFKDILVIVGGEKVPKEVYELVDFNISVTNQPHSEVSALAIFLDYYFKGKLIKNKFVNAKISIIPNEKGKTVIKK